MLSFTVEDGVFELLTGLSNKIAEKYAHQSHLPQKYVATKMRSLAYEIILKKSKQEVNTFKSIEPIIDLLSYYLKYKKNVRNVAEHKRSETLKKLISKIRLTDLGDGKEDFYNVLRFIIALQNSVKADYGPELFQNPFSFGLLDEMVPKPPPEDFGSAQPYPCYPAHVFELPFSFKRPEVKLDVQKSLPYTEYSVDSFDCSPSPDNMSQKYGSLLDNKSYHSPISIASLASSKVSPYSETSVWNLPRLTAPRDLNIVQTDSSEANAKISLASTDINDGVKEVYRDTKAGIVDIWEVATGADMDVPNDIWEVAYKMPKYNDRPLIASSSREMALWRKQVIGDLANVNIISEIQFIKHVKYLLIGVETNTFPFDQESNSFYIKPRLVLEGISQGHLANYVSDLLSIGTYFRRLYKFAFNHLLEDHLHCNGQVYEAARGVIRRYLLEFRMAATSIYEDSCRTDSESSHAIPTLLQILYHVEPLKYEIETVVSIYKLLDPVPDQKSNLPCGVGLMSYLFNEMSLVTHQKTAQTVFNYLYCICSIYFKFIERFIFEGELEDRHNEFFIRKDMQYVKNRSKRYWDKGFHITQSQAVPEFLRPLAKLILLCGKSLRLIKHCNPSDPLILLISSDHPTVKCCTNFDELEQQQRLLDVYRTRCLFVSGEPVTFEQILLKREAERKAFTEMASLKQAETLEKIVAERKRLAQLIIAEKQHSLRVLEAAMAETQAAKRRARDRERRRLRLQAEADTAAEEVDARLHQQEREKLLDYYSKLNMEVEKSKIHTEWKMKRLLLDQSRMQLLSSEERNLKREKLELEHQRNEEIMSKSMQSMAESVDDKNDKNARSEGTSLGDPSDTIFAIPDNNKEFKTPCSIIVEKTSSTPEPLSHENVKSKTDMLSAICNVAKSVFGVTKKGGDSSCDNKKALDAQGNILSVDSENNTNMMVTKSSSSVIGEGLDQARDKIEFQKIREEALKNKLKVMVHEFDQIDEQNNRIKDLENNFEVLPTTDAQRNKLKVLGSVFQKTTSEPTVVLLQPKTEAQREALMNKQKVLGDEFDVPIKLTPRKEPANVAQEEALQNRNKILGSKDVEPVPERAIPRNQNKRSALTLNLKPFTELTPITPNFEPTTPGDIFTGLDLETPTTADVVGIPAEGAASSEVMSPRNEDAYNELGHRTKKDFLNVDGFNFAVMVDVDIAESDVICDNATEQSNDSSPSNVRGVYELKPSRYSVFNLIDGSYSLEHFNPFGVRELKAFTIDHFSSKMDMATSSSSYTHPAIIMKEMEKKPYPNIFSSHLDSEEEDKQKIACDNIATLTACLQKSVMLPLIYQLEVVNNTILTYFLVNLEMYEHLRSLKDYFFLMDGEFSRSICTNLFARLTKTLNPSELLNFATLHNILDKALGSSISHVHKFSDNLSFTITESPLCFQHSSPDVLQCLSLTYTVNWPLNIILSQEALLRYARVFQFLVKMRRISWVLSEDFEAMKLSLKLAGPNARKLQRSPHYVTLQLYRHILASLVRALDSYIVTTCILSSWTDFENDLKKARTLDDLYDCHVVYIKKVLFKCLLNNRSTPVMKLLNDIFTIILKFSRVLKAGEWLQKKPGGNFTHTSYAQLEELFNLFVKLVKYLHKVIMKLMECGYQRHLVELLTIINLNGYYDFERRESNVSVE